MFRSLCFHLPGRTQTFSKPQQQNTPIRGEDAFLGVSADSFQHCVWMPILTTASAVVLVARHWATPLLSFPSMVRRERTQQRRYQPHRQDSELVRHGKQARILMPGKQQAFGMLIVRRFGGKRPSVITVLGSKCCPNWVQVSWHSQWRFRGSPLDNAVYCKCCRTEQQSIELTEVFLITHPVIWLLASIENCAFLEPHWR